MMRVAVTGLSGQLAMALKAAAGDDVILVGRPEVDIRDGRSVREAIAALRPDVLVNAAAYTAVDKAEDEPALSRAVNAEGAENVARAAAAIGAPVIQISTDYVFSGRKGALYVETDETGPLGVYGATKLEGERLAAAANEHCLILRTSWVHGAHGSNFVRTMLRLAGERDVVRVVADQAGCPTQTDDLAEAVLALARNLRDGRADTGVVHVAGSGAATWAELAGAAFAESARLGGPSARVEPITTADYPTRAPRPADSRLDCGLLHRRHGLRLAHWRDGVARTVAALLSR